MSAPTPPKWLQADPAALVRAYRYGVTDAIWMRERRVLPSFRAYKNDDRGVLRFADRVRIEWMRRHPTPTNRSRNDEP